MPKPFPNPLSIGTDICSIPRILRLLKADGRVHHQSKFCLRLAKRLLRHDELLQNEERVMEPLQRYWGLLRERDGRGEMKERAVGVKRKDGVEKLPVGFWWELKKGWEGGLVRCDSMAESEQAAQVDGESEVRNEGEVNDSSRERPGWNYWRAEVFRRMDSFSKWKRQRRFEMWDTDWNAIKKGLLEGKTPTQVFGEEQARLVLGFEERKRLRAGEQVGGEKAEDGVVIEEGIERKSEEPGILSASAVKAETGAENREAAMRKAEEELQPVAQFLAGRFAAKEAIIKAHVRRRLTYHDIAIFSLPSGQHGTRPPLAIVYPEGAQDDFENAQEVRLSISHDGDYATAICLAPDS